MDKSQGVTIGTVLIAAVLAHPISGMHPAFDRAGHAGTHAPSSIPGIRAEGDGPWVASCEYWAPDRRAAKEERYEPAVVWKWINGERREFDQKPKTECGTDDRGRWGFPERVATIEPESPPALKHPRKRVNKPKAPAAKPGPNITAPRITAIIATVPDPVHTNMALQFDRTIDSLIDAAEDNGYLSSYYWLPWNKEHSNSEGGESNEPKLSSEEEREPGLIVFKQLSSKPGKGATVEPQDFGSSLYLFLVGETPTSGVNAYQMERALEIEQDFAGYGKKCRIAFRRSLKVSLDSTARCTPAPPMGDQLDVIGPNYSGGAASLRRAIDEELCRHDGIKRASVRGITATPFALRVMDYRPDEDFKDGWPGKSACHHQEIVYESFSPNAVFDAEELNRRFGQLDISQSSVAMLIEDGTTLGESSERSLRADDTKNEPAKPKFQSLTIRFPREISTLRNAETAQEANAAQNGASPPSPYLHFSLKGSNTSDSVPHLSGELTPLSQESELMAIQHQLQRYRVKYIVISATDVLDALFLAQFLHRVVPDARLVFDGGDLLFEREVDDVPFIGALTIGPYHLVGLSTNSKRGGTGRAFPDWSSEAYYNAASWTFWPKEPMTDKYDDNEQTKFPLAGYQSIKDSDPLDRPPLWLTLIGTDGYYPLGIESLTPSHEFAIMPEIPHAPCPADNPCQKPAPWPIRPPLSWNYLCGFVFLLCVLHSVLITTASFWSPFTRDLAIARNDLPYRRSLYINIGTVMLFGMALVVATPYWFAQGLIISDSFSWAVVVMTLASGVVAIGTTGWQTAPYFWPPRGTLYRAQICFFNVVALTTLAALVGFWVVYMFREMPGDESRAGLFFAYRSLNPTSRVSPAIPVAMLLFGWYLWSLYQTLRLRFSECNRPVVPGIQPTDPPQRSFVADWQLARCSHANDACLYSNIESLLITVEVVQRFVTTKNRKRVARWILGTVYILAFAALTYKLPFHSVDEILQGWLPRIYQFLITALFFPLLMIAISGWIRMVMIWGSMKRDLLQRIENQPIRFAFSRLKNPGWMNMLRQSGLREHWHDLSRSIESVQHLLNEPTLFGYVGLTGFLEMDVTRGTILSQAQALRQLVDGNHVAPNAPPLKACGDIQQNLEQREGLLRMTALERDLADFGEQLLKYVLIPHWTKGRTGLVESAIPLEKDSRKETHEKENKAASLDLHKDEPRLIQAAEEFVAIRYVSLIRAVLVNLRYLMFFIGLTFILTITAWNTYPFQPRQVIDWLFTALLLLLGTGVVWVLAQMYRDPLLSRITATIPNELGIEFYVKLASIGALPILTWLAYQFPDVGGSIFKIFQSGSDVVK